jgi:hypothetical protein
MKKLTVLLVASLLAFCACTSANQSAQRICTIRLEARPDAVAVRETIALRFDTFDADTQAQLKRLDVWLAELDLIGEAACNFRSFDAARAIELAVKGVALAAELKAKGVI